MQTQYYCYVVDNVAHNLCCEIRADDNSSTYTFTTGRSIACTLTTGKSMVLMEHRNNNIVFACFNCTSHTSARISQHKLCATLSTNINIFFSNKVYYLICTFWHIRIEIIHGNQNVWCVWTWIGRILVNYIPRYSSEWNTNIRQPMLKLKTHSGFHHLFLK
jgi:hypothetical protein